ncbi:M20 aminoacylase family protein [Oceanicella actignis]|uniref:Hippurate hydrolase n=1 Tax=Oceanicella actignis TaxID=1189325 RepID=A0A1M7TJ83_9RHOB|nr:hippurate hydrolase [Oceanicella actignis]SHN70785.1 hippurate hydrolase [Oceanicella actignis]
MTLPIPNAIAAMAPELTEWRRDLHMHPELAYEESRTARVVAERLRAFGFDEVHEGVGRTGVVGILHGADGPAADASRRILLRADMDALPMDEATGLPWASRHAGRMHACGHDGHTAMLLGAARRLAQTRAFSGTIVFCFQPAEEGGAGAEAMIADGLLDRWPVRAAFGLHNDPQTAEGAFATAPGPVLAYADQFRIRIRGKGGHAAHPDMARDPLMAGVQLVSAFQTIISRRRDPMQPAVLSVTRFHAGSATNVIADEAELGGTVRAFDDSVARMIIDQMRAQCRLIGEAMGVEIEAELGLDAYPALVNDPEATAFAADICQELVGAERVNRAARPSLGGEDFAFIARRVPAAFVFIGNGPSAPLHHPAYDFNDQILPLGVAWWSRLAERALPRAEAGG